MGKHSEWRKLAKKLRRKRIRQHKAKLRDRNEAEEFNRLQNSPSYHVLLAEKLKADKQNELEEEKLHAARERAWLRAEEEAQREFREVQKKLALAREERAKQNEKIRLEWEKEQKRRDELRVQQENELQEKIAHQELLKEKVEYFIENGGNTPEHLKTILESNPSKATCPFFNKTSTCRFFDVCSRNHIRPGISKIILIPNFFIHYSLEKTENEQIADSSLEFEKGEINKSYRDFYKDVVPEIEKFGRIRLFITCCNHEAHLRGNVFIEYSSTRGALKCFRGLNGRWYGGKQISVQFVNIPNWNSAICGVYFVNRCPKGSSCNFLHTFRNPGNAYSAYEKIRRDTESRQRNHSESRNWRWSESPESSPKTEEWEVDHPSRSTKSERNGFRKKRRSRSREKDRRSHSSKHRKEKSQRRKRK